MRCRHDRHWNPRLAVPARAAFRHQPDIPNPDLNLKGANKWPNDMKFSRANT